MRVRRIINTRTPNKTYNDVEGNSGLEAGFITIAENSESAKAISVQIFKSNGKRSSVI